MGKLQVLPSSIANMIAAGEVVARPASVVKELMENAIDAGATNVNVVVSDAGLTLIQVIDNGCGMSREDAVLCFERHATSKIASASDLEAIGTFGFRGEALASIAAIACVTLKTRRKEDAVGTKVTIGEGGKVSVAECACPTGSNFEIRNIFYNTPARRKFLKSENIELKHIIDEFSHIALCRCGLNFSLTHNNKSIYVLKSAKSLKFRISDLMGNSVAEDLVDVEQETGLLKISGFVGRPQSAKKTQSNEYFFVNGRYFRSPYLHKAVMNAYEEIIPEGLKPPYFLFLEVDPQSVDVNIHPTKAEIKFEDEHIIFQTLYASVKQVLGRNMFGSGIDFDAESSITLPQTGPSFEEFRGKDSHPRVAIDDNYTPFTPRESDIRFDRPAVERSQNYGVLFESRLAEASAAMVISGKYILTPCESGILVVNIKRAQERIFYERNLKALEGSQHISQAALFPVDVEVGAAQKLLFDENADLLRSLGFDIQTGGSSTITVNGVPEGFSCESGKVEQIVENLLFILSDDTRSLGEVMKSEMARKFALLAASSAEEIDSASGAKRLLDSLFCCENTSLTSDGRKISVIISREELDNKF